MTALTPIGLLDLLLRLGTPPELDDTPDVPACEPGEADDCGRERTVEPPADFARLDLEAAAAKATYKSGKRKRDRYPRVDLRRRRIVIVLHQTGVERASSSSRWHLVTAHRTIKPNGTICRLHPIVTRLVAANRVDRPPYHALSIEVGGNFEGIDGSGRWSSPETMGRGRSSDWQIRATRQCVLDLIDEVHVAGGTVEAIIPHRITGRNEHGVPNRQICCGSRVWSEGGEWCADRYGLAVPAPGFALGGLAIPEQWHGRFRNRARETWRG